MGSARRMSAPADTNALEAERCVVGSILVPFPGAIESIESLLQPDDLGTPWLRVVLAAALDVVEQGGRPDPVTVADELERSGLMSQVPGGKHELLALQAVGVAPSSLPHYAGIVIRHSQRERLQSVLADAYAKVKAGDEDGALQAVSDLVNRPTATSSKAQQLRALLLGVNDLEKLPPPDPLIDGLLMRDSLAVLWGKPGCGKTFLALDWALSVATGNWWMGHALDRGNVLYLAAEGSAGLQQRVEAWKVDHKIHQIDNATFLPEAVNLLDGSWVAAMVSEAKRLHPDYIVIDTLARVMVGGDENTSRDVGLVVAAADRMRKATGACVQLVHHDTKAGGTMRGSSALLGAADTSIEVSTEGTTLTVKCEKQKEAEPFHQFKLHRKRVAQSCVLSSHEAVETIEDLDAGRRSVFETFRETFGATGCSQSQLVQHVVEAIGTSRATAYRAINDLLTERLIVNTGKGNRPFLQLATEDDSSHVSSSLTASQPINGNVSSQLAPLEGENRETFPLTEVVA